MMRKGKKIMNDTKICLLGGDTRQTALAYYLAGKGYETAVWGIPFSENSSPGGICSGDFRGVKCSDPESAVAQSRVVILPLPATTDGVRLNCPAAENTPPLMRKELRLTSLLSMLNDGMLLLAGKPGEVLRSMARNANVRLIDYYDDEALQIKNAIPTAEGAIALAMNELPVTLFGTSCCILGYGRIGKRLSEILRALGAKVKVAARSERDLCYAALSGCEVQEIHDFLKSPGQVQVLFNTIPVQLIGKEVLCKLKDNTLLIELASAPGGFVPEALKQCGCRFIRAASLPGKVAACTAGRILFETIDKILEREGICV